MGIIIDVDSISQYSHRGNQGKTESSNCSNEKPVYWNTRILFGHSSFSFSLLAEGYMGPGNRTGHSHYLHINATRGQGGAACRAPLSSALEIATAPTARISATTSTKVTTCSTARISATTTEITTASAAEVTACAGPTAITLLLLTRSAFACFFAQFITQETACCRTQPTGCPGIHTRSLGRSVLFRRVRLGWISRIVGVLIGRLVIRLLVHSTAKATRTPAQETEQHDYS